MGCYWRLIAGVKARILKYEVSTIEYFYPHYSFFQHLNRQVGALDKLIKLTDSIKDRSNETKLVLVDDISDKSFFYFRI